MERKNPNIQALGKLSMGTIVRESPASCMAVIRQLPELQQTLCRRLYSSQYVMINSSQEYHLIHVIANLNAMCTWNECLDFEEKWRRENGKLEGWKRPGPMDCDWPRNKLENTYGRTKEKFMDLKEYLELEKKRDGED